MNLYSSGEKKTDWISKKRKTVPMFKIGSVG